MTWSEEFRLRFQFFIVGLAVVCQASLITMAWSAKRQIDSYRWPSVPGTVDSTVAKTWLDSERKTMFFGRVVYQYVVNNQSYTSDLTDLGPGAKRPDAATALDDVAQ